MVLLSHTYQATVSDVTYVVLLSDTYQGQMVYSALFGLYTGGLSTLFSSLTVQFVGVRLLNTAFSVLSFVIGTGYIAGPLLAGRGGQCVCARVCMCCAVGACVCVCLWVHALCVCVCVRARGGGGGGGYVHTYV